MESPRSWDEVAADLAVDVSLFLCSYSPPFAPRASFRHAVLAAMLVLPPT